MWQALQSRQRKAGNKLEVETDLALVVWKCNLTHTPGAVPQVCQKNGGSYSKDTGQVSSLNQLFGQLCHI